MAFNVETTRKGCCCSIGKAWGKSCSQCPLSGTGNYNIIVFYIKIKTKIK